MTIITRGNRLHGVTSFPIRRATFDASPVLCSSGDNSLAYGAGWRSLHSPAEEIRHGGRFGHVPAQLGPLI